MSQSAQMFDTHEVKAHFVRHGTSYHAWARKNGFSAQLVYLVIHNKRGTGPIASRIAAALRRQMKKGGVA